MDKKSLTLLLKDLARQRGISACGISPAGYLEKEAPRLEKWLEEGKNGRMAYLENHFDKRLDPRLLVEGARSVVSFAFNYFTPPRQDPADKNIPLISRYAYGEEYHRVIKDILKSLCLDLKQTAGDFSYRIFVDSAPVLEREWARRAGLGWVGKSGLFIIPNAGSFFFLAEIITDLEFEYDAPFPEKGLCGGCRRCMMACPTGAIVSEHVVDASKCISYLNLELKDKIPEEFSGKMNNCLIGCDTCLQACPWNRLSTPHREKRFLPQSDFLSFDFQGWKELEREDFERMFRNSPLKRAGYDKIRSTLQSLEENQRTEGTG